MLNHMSSKLLIAKIRNLKTASTSQKSKWKDITQSHLSLNTYGISHLHIWTFNCTEQCIAFNFFWRKLISQREAEREPKGEHGQIDWKSTEIYLQGSNIMRLAVFRGKKEAKRRKKSDIGNDIGNGERGNRWVGQYVRNDQEFKKRMEGKFDSKAPREVDLTEQFWQFMNRSRKGEGKVKGW